MTCSDIKFHDIWHHKRGKIRWAKLLLCHTVEGERFAGLKVCSFNPTEVFAEILSRCLGQKYFLFSVIKERHLHSRKNFRSTLEYHDKRKSLAQQIWYIHMMPEGMQWYNLVCFMSWHTKLARLQEKSEQLSKILLLMLLHHISIVDVNGYI